MPTNLCGPCAAGQCTGPGHGGICEHSCHQKDAAPLPDDPREWSAFGTRTLIEKALRAYGLSEDQAAAVAANHQRFAVAETRAGVAGTIRGLLEAHGDLGNEEGKRVVTSAALSMAGDFAKTDPTFDRSAFLRLCKPANGQ